MLVNPGHSCLESRSVMEKALDEVPEQNRRCPFCDAEGTVIRVMKYGSMGAEKQIKLQCPDCEKTWLYHTDD